LESQLISGIPNSIQDVDYCGNNNSSALWIPRTNTNILDILQRLKIEGAINDANKPIPQMLNITTFKEKVESCFSFRFTKRAH